MRIVITMANQITIPPRRGTWPLWCFRSFGLSVRPIFLARGIDNGTSIRQIKKANRAEYKALKFISYRI
jgi:hypothetical protein